MKIGIFTDSHYSSQAITCGCRYNNQSLRKIEEAYSFFERSGCELVICLGDLLDTEATVELERENLRQVKSVVKKSPIPSVIVMGNHDAFTLTPEEFYSILGIDAPNDIRCGGKRLIFIDCCYFKSGVHYAPGDSNWRDTYLPNADRFLADIQGSEEEIYVFLHQNIDPAIREDHRLFNSKELFEGIQKSGSVKAVFQGHFHGGCRSEYDGVKYITLPAMCESEGAFFVFDI